MITRAERRAVRRYLRQIEGQPMPALYWRYLCDQMARDSRRGRVFPYDLDRSVRYHFARTDQAARAGQRGPARVYCWSKYLHTLINLRGAQQRRS